MRSDGTLRSTMFDEVTCEAAIGPLDEVSRRSAPKILHVAGDVTLLRSTARVSIVGSRKASEVSLSRARRLATELAHRHVVVVSGLALGVDAVAHTSSIRAGGRTIAVLGTPLDRVYPKEHAELQAEIARDHLVVSQFAPGETTGKWSFPARNRTMALLSHATVIVEASDESGTLHQGWEAIRLGRPLFFMRSLLDDANLVWPRKLMKYGARPLADTDELLDVIPAADVALPRLDEL